MPSITPKTTEKMRYPKPQQGEKWKSDLIKRKEAQQLSAYTRIRKLKPRNALWEHPHEQGQAIISHEELLRRVISMPQQVVYTPFTNSEPSNCASSVHPPLERKRSRTEEDHENEVDNAFFVEGRGKEADLSAYRSMNEKPPTVKFHQEDLLSHQNCPQ